MFPLTGNKVSTFRICFLLLLFFVAIMVIFRGQTFLQMQNAVITSVMKHMGKNATVSDNRIRVICMILTTPSNWQSRGRAVQNTWAKRCHRANFFYTKIKACNGSTHPICKDPNAVGLDISDGRDHLTAKSRGMLNYSYTNYAEEGDYFLKADDDTYVIMENLQLILSNFSLKHRLYLGRKALTHLPRGYNSGGAGYIISNEAAKLIVQNGSSFPGDCAADGGYEDVEIGRCLAKFGIYPHEDMDSTGRLTFHSDNPFQLFQGGHLSPHYFINFTGVEFGNKDAIKTRGHMLSKWTATMHYVSPPEMYMHEFLLYHLNRGSDKQI